jgi:hypothetical protein
MPSCQEILYGTSELDGMASLTSTDFVKVPKKPKKLSASSNSQLSRRNKHMLRLKHFKRTLLHLNIKEEDLSNNNSFYHLHHHPQWHRNHFSADPVLSFKRVYSVSKEDATIPNGTNHDPSDIIQNQILLVPNQPLAMAQPMVHRPTTYAAAREETARQELQDDLDNCDSQAIRNHVKELEEQRDTLQKKLNDEIIAHGHTRKTQQKTEKKYQKVKTKLKEKDAALKKLLAEKQLPSGLNRHTLTSEEFLSLDMNDGLVQSLYGLATLHSSWNLKQEKSKKGTPPSGEESSASSSSSSSSESEEEETTEAERQEEQMPSHESMVQKHESNRKLLKHHYPKKTKKKVKEDKELLRVWNKSASAWASLVLLLTVVLFPDLSVQRSKVVYEKNKKSRNGLTEFEQCLATKMFIKTGYDFRTMGTIWGVHYTTIGRYVKKWLPRWRNTCEGFVRLNVDREYIDKCQPKDWPEYYGMPIACVVDGKVILTEIPRRSSVKAKAMYSNKNGTQGILGLTWSGAGTGLCLLVTDLFCPCAHEKDVIGAHKSWLVQFPPGVGRLVDRGMADCDKHYKNLVQAFFPAFLKGRAQMARVEIIDARRQSSNRYTCETVFSRVVQHKLLDGVVKKEHWHFMNDAWIVGHFGAQLYRPLIASEISPKLKAMMLAQGPSPLESQVLNKIKEMKF